MNKLLLPLVRTLSILSLAHALTPTQPSLKDIQITDSYTKTKECTDPDHWFIIEGQLSIPKGSQQNITFQVPEAFDSFPQEPFSIEYNSNSVATISRPDQSTNNFTISIPEKSLEDITTTFNFLAKLTSDAKSKVTEPKDIIYSFYSEDDMFNDVIDYVAKNTSAITTDGGIYKTNNTAWFTVDLPMKTFLNPVYLTSQASSSSDYVFDTKLTKFEVVTAVDSFNEPIKSIPYTTVHDYSTGDEIRCLFNSTISGGLYFRVTYFTKELSSSSISNIVELTYPDEGRSVRLFGKRDTSTTLGSELYSESAANIGSTTNDETTSSNAAMTPTYSNSTLSSYASQSSTAPEVVVITSSSSQPPTSAVDSTSNSMKASSSVISVVTSSDEQASSMATESTDILSSAPSSSNSTSSPPLSTQSATETQNIISSASVSVTEASYIGNTTTAATQYTSSALYEDNSTTVAVSSIE